MHVVPVLDLLNGRVVRGVGGRRPEYRPVVSRLTPSCQPADVALAFRDAFGFSHLYLADLNAIAGSLPAAPAYAALRALGFRLWVDSGIRDRADALAADAAGAEGIVVGLETVRGPGVLADLCRDFGPRVVFSLDLRGGELLGEGSGWERPDAFGVAEQAVALGARRILVLDLARVGTGAGTGTEALCARLAEKFPGLEVAAGGGVRGPDDLRRLKACGVRAALVASALHDGALTREDLAAL